MTQIMAFLVLLILLIIVGAIIGDYFDKKGE